MPLFATTEQHRTKPGRPFFLLLLLALAVLSGCRRQAIPAPASPPPEPCPPVSPPPPACEALDEGCTAEDTTTLDIPSALRFRPPAGWHYADQPTQVVARSDDGKAILAFAASGGHPDRRDDHARIVDRLGVLFDQLGVTGVDLESFSKRLGKPDTRLEEAGAFEIQLWEIDESRQKEPPMLGEETPGTALVVLSPTPVGLLLVGVAFVTPDAAAEQAPRVMNAVKSLRVVDPNASETPETSDAKAEESNDVP